VYSFEALFVIGVNVVMFIGSLADFTAERAIACIIVVLIGNWCLGTHYFAEAKEGLSVAGPVAFGCLLCFRLHMRIP
jgi:hypothetical protein